MSLLDNLYQTIPLPNGNTLQGLFPTHEWYNSFASALPLFGKTILDVGCCTMSYGIQAIRDGAKFYTGVDNEPLRQQQSNYILDTLPPIYTSKSQYFLSNIEDFTPETHDIIIFSMIIHWLKDPEHHIQRLCKYAKEHIIFIYRHPQGLDEIGFRPEVAQLSFLLGLQPLTTKKLILYNRAKHNDGYLWKKSGINKTNP